jgi:hypothetical protein
MAYSVELSMKSSAGWILVSCRLREIGWSMGLARPNVAWHSHGPGPFRRA